MLRDMTQYIERITAQKRLERAKQEAAMLEVAIARAQRIASEIGPDANGVRERAVQIRDGCDLDFATADALFDIAYDLTEKAEAKPE